MKKWQIFKQGVLQELPLQLGVFPFGIIYGVMAIESGLTLSLIHISEPTRH